MRRPTNLQKFFALLLIYVFSVTVAAAESAQVRIPGPGGALTGGGSLTAATPTFSPGSGTYSSTQSVTISTATSGCGSYIYWSTVHNPPTTGDNHGTAVTVSSSETVYAKVIGCPGYLDSSVGDAIYTIGGSANACPTGANYLNSATNTLVTLASLGITKCYYISAAGSDSGAGSTEATPWLHAPFMPNCSVSCHTVQAAMAGTAGAGYGFIFRGGDTWHFGNSAASPYTGGTWQFNPGSGDASGTSAHPIYLGFDPGWYSSGSWSRPILTGDNAVCNAGDVSGNCHSIPITSSSYQEYYVGSCSYQIGGSNNMVDLSWVSYWVLDNFELTGMCSNKVGQPFGTGVYVNYNDIHGTMQYLNLYTHGWTHVQYADHNAGSGCNSGTVCFSSYAFEGVGNSSGIVTDILRYDVIDGSDSDPFGMATAYASFYDAERCAFRYTSQGIMRNMHIFADNLYEYFFENGHSNVAENYAEWPSGDNVMYNNVFRHLETQGLTNGVGIWMWPNVGDTDFIFNNVVYDEGQMELFNIGRNLQNTGTYSYFNNTIEFTAGTGNSFGCNPTASESWVLLTTNNHFITESSSPYNSVCNSPPSGGGPVTPLTNLQMTHATATSDGYTAAQTYAYSPTSGSKPTVLTGTNGLGTGPCGKLNTAAGSDATLSAAALACKSDTTYACAYNATSHTVSCPVRTVVPRPLSGNWDIGGYQWP